MKFFSDFSSCYRPTPQPPPTQPATTIQVAFVDGERGACSKRNKTNGSKYWRPELSVISEDGVVPLMETDQRKTQPAKKGPCKNRSIAANKARSAHYHDELDYYYNRKNSMPVIVPAFSPMSFMF